MIELMAVIWGPIICAVSSDEVSSQLPGQHTLALGMVFGGLHGSYREREQMGLLAPHPYTPAPSTASAQQPLLAESVSTLSSIIVGKERELGRARGVCGL